MSGTSFSPRAARSARLTTHFDLDFPAEPVNEPYWCHKYRRECRPVQEAAKFLARYTADTVRRLRAFAAIRSDARVAVHHGDARRFEPPLPVTGIVTSPPYPGLIDYHEQHRYAYELLGLEERQELEIGPAARGNHSGRARGVRGRDDSGARAGPDGAARRCARRHRRERQPRSVPANPGSRRLGLEERTRRHVNRRTGRRSGEFFEHVLVCRA